MSNERPSDDYLRGLEEAAAIVDKTVSYWLNEQFNASPVYLDAAKDAERIAKHDAKSIRALASQLEQSLAAPVDKGPLRIGGHQWVDANDLVKWPHCAVCGIIRRHDDKNNPCKGAAKLALREHYSQGAATHHANAAPGIGCVSVPSGGVVVGVPIAWIATTPNGNVLHMAAADGWKVDCVMSAAAPSGAKGGGSG